MIPPPPVEEPKLELIVDKSHIIDLKKCQYFSQSRLGKKWNKLGPGYCERTVEYFWAINGSNTVIGKEIPRFPTDRPYPYGY